MPKTVVDERVYRFLQNALLVAEDDFRRVLDEANASQGSVEDALVDLGFYTDEQAGKLMADAYGVRFVDLGRVTIDREAARVVPEIVAKKQGMLAYGWKDGRLQLAMTDPLDQEQIGYVEKKTGMSADAAYTTPNALARALKSYAEDAVANIVSLAERLETLRQEGVSRAEGEGETLVVKAVDAMLKYGFDNDASDIHVEPHEVGTVVRYRVDGILHDVLKLPKAMHELIVARVKILSNMRTDEHFAAQDGKFRARLDGRPLDVRVSIVPVLPGEKIVMRLLSERGRALTLQTLGLGKADLKRVRQAADKPYGMILSTGPTGSGKTTTLYALLKILNGRDVNIQTIEDPIEYDIDGVNQIQVNVRTNLTFAAGLRSIVRQDPDIIMVGEIRDAETAGIAVNAAMTGHLVLSTLHTNDAATAVPRLLDMEVEPFLLSSSVNVIVAQRLVRRVCESCITSEQVVPETLEAAIPPDVYRRFVKAKRHVRTYRGKGCNVCHGSGYAGRIGLFEVLTVSDAIRELVMRRANASEITRKVLREASVRP